MVPKYQQLHETAGLVVESTRSLVLSPLRLVSGLTLIVQDLEDKDLELLASLIRTMLDDFEEQAILISVNHGRLNLDLVGLPTETPAQTPNRSVTE